MSTADIRDLRRAAEEARAAYRAGALPRYKASEAIMPFLDAANQRSVELAKKYGQRPRKIHLTAYLR